MLPIIQVCVAHMSMFNWLSKILITNLTYVEDFVKVLQATRIGSCIQCIIIYQDLPYFA